MSKKNAVLSWSVWGLSVATLVTAVDARATTADAQSPAPSEAAAPAENAVPEIVVTALKRSSDIQKIPASVFVLGSQGLTSRGISDISAAAAAIPNLNYAQSYGNTLITIRGVGSNVQSGATEPTVAIYADGVYIPRSFMATLRAVDLDRVEVLRGPQGTLYGRNATGGAINFISAAPSKTFDAKIEGFTGSRNQWGVNGYISGPIAEGVYFRASGGREEQDGFVDVVNTGQKLGGTNATYARAALLLEPTSNLSIDLSFRYDRDTAPVAYQAHIGPITIGTPATTTSEPYKILANQGYASSNRTMIAAAAIKWEMSDNLTLKSLTSYVNGKNRTLLDSDGSLLPIFYTPTAPRDSKSYAEELILLGDFGPLSFIVGGYLYKEKFGNLLDVFLEGPQLMNYIGQTAKIRNAAAYGDLTYSLTDKFRVNLGLRVNHESNSYGQYYTLQPLPVTSVTSLTLENKSTEVLPKVALQYDVNSATHTYIQYSRGYKSGGGNLPLGVGTFAPLYGPEKIDAFEAGIKSQFLDRKLTANISGFYYKYDGLQITQAVPPVGNLVNNAKARVYGIEAEFRAQVTPTTSLMFAPTYTHATFKDFNSFDTVTGTLVALDGSPLPLAPKWSINAEVQQRIPLGGNLLNQLELSASLRYNSTSVLNYFNLSPEDRQSPIALVDLTAALVDVGNKTRLSAFVRNVTNKIYLNYSANFGIGPVATYGAPRTFGIRISRRY